MVDFDFYPHTCVIYRGVTIHPTTGVETPVELYSGKCYLQQGNTSLKGDWLQGEDTVMLDNADIIIKSGDSIEVTLENGSVFKAKIKQAYPLKDDDFGGQDLKLYQQDAT